MTVRRATTADLAAIGELERLGFDVAEQWSQNLWSQELAGADRHVLVATEADRVVGVISIQVLAPGSDLMRVVVDPGERRRGIATELITAGLDLAAAEGAHKMLLEVRWDNDAAIACYGRAGFEQLTTRPNYYGPGKDALVMRAWDLDRRLVDRRERQGDDHD